MRRLAILLVTLTAVALAGAGAARASTVAIELQPEGQDEDLAPNVIYTAGPGEANRLTVSGDGLTFTVADPGAVITVGAHCQATDAHHATCVAPAAAVGTGEAVAKLGDGDDTATGVATADGGTGNDTLQVAGTQFVYSPARTDGGPGNDVVLGGGPMYGDEGDDRVVSNATDGASPAGYVSDPAVYGGDGADTVVGPTADGGPGDDVVRGTPGADVLSGGVGTDLVDGGAGEDLAGYGSSPVGVHVDLRHPEDAGGPTEHDRLVSIEDVDGSLHHDVLTGDAGPNVLGPGQGGGNDVVAGGRGADTLVGGPNMTRGRSRLYGGPGPDTMEVNLARDRYSCGTGRDRVDVPDEGFAHQLGGIGRIPRNCERIASGLGPDLLLLGVLRGHAGRLVARMTGPACAGSITVRSPDRHGRPGRLWARTRWHRRTRAHAPHRLALRLTRPGRRALRRHRLAVERVGWDERCRKHPFLSVSAWLARL